MALLQHIWQLVTFALLLAGPVPLCLSLILLARKKKERSTPVQCVLVFLVGWCVIETCIALFLGAVHRLTFRSVLFSETVLFLLGIAVFVYLKRRVPSLSSLRLPKVEEPFSHLENLILTSALCVGLVLFWRLATHPIVEYDSLGYHLPFMANWYQKASLVMLDQFYFPQYPSTYPYNWEALCTLFLMPFHEDFLVAFPNLIAWALLGVSVYLLSLEMGATRAKSMAAAVLVLTVPLVAGHVNEMHVDLPFAAMFMSALYFALLYFRTRVLVYFALSLAALGMFLGIKTSGPMYGLLLLGVFSFLGIKARIGRSKLAGDVNEGPCLGIPLAIGAILCSLSLGGFWYVRNLADVGNPLGYVRIGIGGLTLFPGPLSVADFHQTTLAHLFRFTNLSHWKVLVGQAWLNLHLPFVAMLLQVVLMPMVFLLGRATDRKKQMLGLAALLLLTGFLYWSTPYSADNGSNQLQITSFLGGQMRFAFPFMGVLGVTAAVVATCLRTRDEILAAVVAISSGLAIDKPRAFYVIVVLVFVWAVFVIVKGANTGVSGMKRSRRTARALAAAVLVVAIAGVSFVAREKRDGRRVDAYGAILDFIEKNVSPDEIIGHLTSNRSYLFYGKNLNRTNEYVAATGDDRAAWISDLRQRGVSVVAVGPFYGPWKSSKELAWLERPDGPFVRVFGRDPEKEPVLFRLRRGNS